MADRGERHVRAHAVGEGKFLGAESKVDKEVNGLARPLKQQHLTGCIEARREQEKKDDTSEGERGVEERARRRVGEVEEVRDAEGGHGERGVRTGFLWRRACSRAPMKLVMPAPPLCEREDLAVDPVDLDKIGEDRSKMRKVIMPGKVRLKRGITVDSGSHHNVMPRRMVKRSRIRPSEGSKRGLHYVAANKGRIPNEGETDFKFETEEGELEDWTFQIAEVNKALASIADRVDHGYRVTFDKDEKTGRDASYMLHKKSKKIIKMTRHGNVWRVEAIVDVDNIDEDRMPASFARQG